MEETVKQRRGGRKPTCLCGVCRICKRRVVKRRYQAKHPEKTRAQSLRYRAAHPKYASKVMVKSNYRLRDEEYEALFAKQKGLCAICTKSESTRDRKGVLQRLSVDHDHSCCPIRKKSCGDCIRGLLCNSCNRGIGLLKDDIPVLEAAISYLKSYARKRSRFEINPFI